MAVSPLGLAVLVMLLALAAVKALGGAYKNMLLTARTPLCLRGGAGECLLFLFFSIASLLHRLCPAAMRKSMQAEAKEKVSLLATRDPPVAPGGVCFIGSSTFTYWNHLARDMAAAEVPVFNAAFGGSSTHDILPHMEALCTRYKPQVVVYFCGTNNLAQGMKVSSVLEGFQLFKSSLREHLPDTHIVYLAITITPFYTRWNINNVISKAMEANLIMERYCTREDNSSAVTFVHTNDCEFAQDPTYYLGDAHHLNDEGHAMLAAVLLPAICSSILSHG